MTRPPILYSLPILTGREAQLEAALDDLPDDAFRPIAPGGCGVFVGGGELGLLLYDADPGVFKRDTFETPEAEPLLRVLSEHTAFDPFSPERYVVPDVHHASDRGRAAPDAAGVTGGG